MFFEDREHDWMAEQLREEAALDIKFSEMYGLKKHHEKNCDARALREEHHDDCDAESVKVRRYDYSARGKDILNIIKKCSKI